MSTLNTYDEQVESIRALLAPHDADAAGCNDAKFVMLDIGEPCHPRRRTKPHAGTGHIIELLVFWERTS